MALDDGSGVAALGGGVGCQLKIAVMALGSGGGRRTCNDGVGIAIVINVVKAVGLLLQHLARMAREDTSNARDVCQRQWQGNRCIAEVEAAAVAAVRMQRWCWQGEGKKSMAWCQTGTGKAGAMQ